jgi:hypothetical protein
MTLSSAGLGSFGGSGQMCAFFRNRDEEYRVLLPFIRHGIEHGERGFHIVDPARLDDHRRRLADGGIDVAAEAEEETT